MKIAIVGTGKVGSMLVEELSGEDHDIVVIDSDPDALRQNTERYDVMGLLGNGATVDVQKEAGADKADLLIATTNLDERNLLASLTPAGIALQERAKHIPLEMEKCCNLNMEERITLYRLLYRMLEYVEDRRG